MARAIVVLGCRLRWAGEDLVGAAGRRVRAAAALFDAGDPLVVVASGGQSWDGVVEADAMRDALVRLGVPSERVARERCSFTTRENARFTALTLRRRGVTRVSLVTCDWHMSRARAHFARERLAVDEVGVAGPPPTWTERAWRWGRERVAARLDGAHGVARCAPG